MDFSHVAQQPGLNPLPRHADGLEGMALVAHLRLHFALPRGCHDPADLVNIVGQRLLAIDVLAGLQGGHRDYRVRVVGRGDDYRVDVFLLVEHGAEILVDLGLRIGLEGLGCVCHIDVAKGHDVLGLAGAEIAAAHAAHADAGNVELVSRRLACRAASGWEQSRRLPLPRRRRRRKPGVRSGFGWRVHDLWSPVLQQEGMPSGRPPEPTIPTILPVVVSVKLAAGTRPPCFLLHAAGEPPRHIPTR